MVKKTFIFYLRVLIVLYIIFSLYIFIFGFYPRIWSLGIKFDITTIFIIYCLIVQIIFLYYIIINLKELEEEKFERMIKTLWNNLPQVIILSYLIASFKEKKENENKISVK